MGALYEILGLIGVGLIVWLMYRTVKNRPDFFSREKLNASLYSMGILALILIVFISILVLILRNT